MDIGSDNKYNMAALEATERVNNDKFVFFESDVQLLFGSCVVSSTGSGETEAVVLFPWHPY